MFDWLKRRLRERTSLDGFLLISCGLCILFIGPIAKYLAYLAIIWGVWTLLRKG